MFFSLRCILLGFQILLANICLRTFFDIPFTLFRRLVIQSELYDIISCTSSGIVPVHYTFMYMDETEKQIGDVPNDTAYKRWSCHSGLKLRCKLCRTFPPPAMGARFTVFWGHAGHADPLDGWCCFSQKRVMSRPIQVRQL